MRKPAASVWTRDMNRQAKAPTLDRTTIVREAIALLDAEGLDALSMRRLATRLNSGATSIYWHVHNKEELLELVVDEVYAELELAPGEPGMRWRDVVQRFAYSMLEAMVRHPWAVPLVGTRPSIGPNALRVLSALTGAFARAGFHRQNIDFAAATVIAYVIGMATSEVAWRRMVALSGGDARAIEEEMRPLLQQAAAGYPDLMERFDCEFDDPAVKRALAFDFGLASLLDGLAVRLDQQEPPTPPMPPLTEFPASSRVTPSRRRPPRAAA